VAFAVAVLTRTSWLRPLAFVATVCARLVDSDFLHSLQQCSCAPVGSDHSHVLQQFSCAQLALAFLHCHNILRVYQLALTIAFVATVLESPVVSGCLHLSQQSSCEPVGSDHLHLWLQSREPSCL
jgi:hypothetical protein